MMGMDVLRFLGYSVLFFVILLLIAAGYGEGVLLVSGGVSLALLWMLLQKLGQINEKLDELLKKRDEHDV